jgi:tetratricopeptide (TPR) repeat protein
MSDYHFDLSDVQPKVRAANGKKGFFTWFMQVLTVVLLLLVLWQLRRPRLEISQQGLTVEQVLELAQKLENLELAEPAAATWKQYLEMSDADAEKAARLWYRIGTIQQNGHLYAEAVASFARSQALCKIDLLENEIARRTQECLESLGLFTAAKRELRQRIDLKPDGSKTSADEEVLAEIGSWKITRADWERDTQEQIDASLSMLGGSLDNQKTKNLRKKAMLERLQDPGTFTEQFQQFVLRELLHREAREKKLAETPEFIAFMRLSERQFLEQSLLNSLPVPEVSPAEMQAYYEEHQDDFKKDDKVQPFSEVEAQIRSQLHSQKRLQAQDKFFAGLIDKYDVVFHSSKLTPPSATP